MHTLELSLQGAWRVLIAGLVLGAGLPALFGLGIRAMAYGAGGDAENHRADAPGPRAHPIGTVIGWLLFAVVALGALLGILYIVVSGLGMKLSFSNGIPTIVDK
ncbi:hypothetical protein [Krasilnikovia sp. MM14-A1259]|uniref:hypothetical protein n=1 Tax=Krasilnikovia sp. MM14-A1259 TaxID=3373539 RepID=UPI0037FDF457